MMRNKNILLLLLIHWYLHQTKNLLSDKVSFLSYSQYFYYVRYILKEVFYKKTGENEQKY